MDAEELERLRLLAAAFEHTPVMLGVVAGPDLRMVALNASARALVGDPGAGATLDGWPGLDRQELEERCREVLETGRRFVSRERRGGPSTTGRTARRGLPRHHAEPAGRGGRLRAGGRRHGP